MNLENVRVMARWVNIGTEKRHKYLFRSFNQEYDMYSNETERCVICERGSGVCPIHGHYYPVLPARSKANENLVAAERSVQYQQ